jgi:SAM-dependent MidA family methyltransferase
LDGYWTVNFIEKGFILQALNSSLSMDLIGIIRQEIERQGALSFARFMELALYHPQWGYYERQPHVIGRQGDYYTSVSVGSLFGELLARRFACWLDEGALGERRGAGSVACDFCCLEAGAHDGRLALDLLSAWKRIRPEQFETLQYWILEPSARRQSWQRETLRGFASKIHWVDSWKSLPRNGFPGIVLANELLDAMPVHRFGWDAQRQEWFEWGVVWRQDRLDWIRLRRSINGPRPGWFENASDARRELPEALTSILPDGFTIEISPAAEDWWREASRWLRAGMLVAIDYGLEQEDFFIPSRANGTLVAYRQHRLNPDVLAQPGLQDLSALVNFTALRAIGEASGLTTLRDTTQERFLAQEAVNIGMSALGIDSPERIRQFQTLTHPHHLGHALRVLVQQRSLVNRVAAQ